MSQDKPVKILRTLRAAGYEAWYVGGCVRDALLGRPIHDWDVTTSALPEETMACFARCVPTGIRHGTITVLEDGAQAEVTTYRTDGSYRDGRHPEQVTFVRSLREDLSRRDFTVNAMAMDEEGQLVDLFGGRQDLEHRILRCVGEPERRFREDALRMLRALRFSAQLGFVVEPETLAAIERCAPLCKALSAERVRDEVEKTLLSPHPEVLSRMAELGLLAAFGWTGSFAAGWLADLPPDRRIRWAGLCRAVPDLDLTLLRLDKRTTQDAMAAGRVTPPADDLGWKRLAAAQGLDRARLTAALEGESERLEQIVASGQCLTLRDLAITGGDLPDLQGPEIRRCLAQLLDHVLAFPEDNSRQRLLELSSAIAAKEKM